MVETKSDIKFDRYALQIAGHKLILSSKET